MGGRARVKALGAASWGVVVGVGRACGNFVVGVVGFLLFSFFYVYIFVDYLVVCFLLFNLRVNVFTLYIFFCLRNVLYVCVYRGERK